MSDVNDRVKRQILPIPDAHYVGLTTYDAKDPETKFPPIEPVRPPKGAPNVLIVLLDDVGFGASSTFGDPVNMLADAAGHAHRTQSPLGEYGRYLRIGHVGSRI
jgi:hypothetical protein